MGLLQIPASGDVSGGGVGAEGRKTVVGRAQRLQRGGGGWVGEGQSGDTGMCVSKNSCHDRWIRTHATGSLFPGL